jgi:hypothetical protein
MTPKNYEQIIAESAIVRELDTAESIVSHCVTPHAVMLGREPTYIVATMANCQRLEKLGFEWAGK